LRHEITLLAQRHEITLPPIFSYGGKRHHSTKDRRGAKNLWRKPSFFERKSLNLFLRVKRIIQVSPNPGAKELFFILRESPRSGARDLREREKAELNSLIKDSERSAIRA